MKLEFKWVIIIFIVHQLWHLGEKLLGFYNNINSYNIISGVIFIGVYIWFIYLMLSQLKAKNGGFLHRRQALLSGLFVGLMLVASAPVTIFILNYFIEPGYFNNMILMSLDNGNYSSYGEAALEYGFWNYVILYMAVYLIIGVLSASGIGYLLHEVPKPVTE